MRDEFVEYLESIGICTEALKNRIQAHIDQAEKLVGEPVVDLLVEDYFDDQTRVYSDLAAYTAQWTVSVKNFTTGEEYFVMSRPTQLIGIAMRVKDYTFGQAPVASSRLHLELVYAGTSTVGGTLRAAGSNCVHLEMIYRKYELPNLGPPSM